MDDLGKGTDSRHKRKSQPLKHRHRYTANVDRKADDPGTSTDTTDAERRVNDPGRGTNKADANRKADDLGTETNSKYRRRSK